MRGARSSADRVLKADHGLERVHHAARRRIPGRLADDPVDGDTGGLLKGLDRGA
jgi:hypothetical protein